MKKYLLSAAIMPAMALAACGGGAGGATSNVVVDDLNTSETLNESTVTNEVFLNGSDLNPLSPVDNSVSLDGAIAADNASNAL